MKKTPRAVPSADRAAVFFGGFRAAVTPLPCRHRGIEQRKGRDELFVVITIVVISIVEVSCFSLTGGTAHLRV
jgi:hypothetical protein